MGNIPKRFKLFADNIEVVDNDRACNAKGAYGLCWYADNTILLATHENEKLLSEDRRISTFYHEKVHMILDHMNEYKLSENEKFVDIFAKLLRQSDETAEYS